MGVQMVADLTKNMIRSMPRKGFITMSTSRPSDSLKSVVHKGVRCLSELLLTFEEPANG